MTQEQKHIKMMEALLHELGHSSLEFHEAYKHFVEYRKTNCRGALSLLKGLSGVEDILSKGYKYIFKNEQTEEVSNGDQRDLEKR